MEDEKEVAHLTNEVPHLTLDNFHLDSQVEKKPLTKGPELRFVATVTTGSRVKFLPTV